MKISKPTTIFLPKGAAMKTLINTLYIGLLIIAPVSLLFFSFAAGNLQFEHPEVDYLRGPCALTAFLAVLFAPMILALIQNTAHKIAISLLNLAVFFSSNTLCKDGNQTGFWFCMGALGALWLWQCFDGRRPRNLPR
jgi:hypothetical protein